MDWGETTARRDEKHLRFVIWLRSILEVWQYVNEAANKHEKVLITCEHEAEAVHIISMLE